MIIKPSTRIARYEIIKLLGRGGMADVYLARHVGLDVEVAIKFIRKERFPQEILSSVVKRFHNEARRMAKLSHPHIVRVSDDGVYHGVPYFVMDYLPGGTLKKYLGKPMPYQQAAGLLVPIAKALVYAHSEGVIHRDVKPTNILLSETGQLMLSDFGVAKVLDSEQTQGLTATGASIGTPEYMAPEQALGKKIDQRVDVYSLGVILYELVTGRRPYTADTPMEVVLKQNNEPLPSPSRFAKGLPAQTEQMIKKALAKEPGGRFADMGAFTGALDKLADGAKPTTSKRTTRTRKKAAVLPREKKAQVQTRRQTEQKRPFNAKWPIEVMGVIGMGLIIFAGMKMFGNMGGVSAAEEQIEPTASIHTAVETPTIIPTPILGIGSTYISEQDGMRMVYVPEGEFLMGSNDNINELDYLHVSPMHTEELNAFWIDQTEVTRLMFSNFIRELITQGIDYSDYFDFGTYYYGGASNKIFADSKGIFNNQYEVTTEYENHPAVYITWYGAKAYCEWYDRHLPTEAEWEKAARGTDGRKYPWGNKITCDNLNYVYCPEFQSTSPVGYYAETGASPYDAYDMAGNVWEWVINSDPCTYGGQLLKGGHYGSDPRRINSAVAICNSPTNSQGIFGFRCALDAE